MLLAKGTVYQKHRPNESNFTGVDNIKPNVDAAYRYTVKCVVSDGYCSTDSDFAVPFIVETFFSYLYQLPNLIMYETA
jgi:hypothetical protein